MGRGDAMIILQTKRGGIAPRPREGLIIMTTHTTATLTAALMGDDAISTPAAKKANTRTVRKFLRDELGGGKAVVGKGARYALELKAAELRAMKKKFAAWEIAQEEAKQARREALEAAKTATATETPEEPTTDTTPESDIEDDEDTPLEGPSDEEIAEMISSED